MRRGGVVRALRRSMLAASVPSRFGMSSGRDDSGICVGGYYYRCVWRTVTRGVWC